MTPAEFKLIRRALKLDEEAFATELGYGGSLRNRAGLIRDYEKGRKHPIPTYIARLAFLLLEHFLAEENHLPMWPPMCEHNPPKRAGE